MLITETIEKIIDNFKKLKETKANVIDKIANILLNVPSTITNNIQEMHIAAGYIICGIVEDHFFGLVK